MKLWKETGFIGGLTEYNQASLVLFGAPMDFTTSFRPGARFGPRRMREVSYGLEEYSYPLDRELQEAGFYDAGDVQFPFGNVGKALAAIKKTASQILADGKIPFMLGGDHLVSFPAIEAAAAHYSDLVVLHFDAHADLRAEFLGEPESHATVLGKAVNLLGGNRVYQFGIRSGGREEFAVLAKKTNFFPDEVLPALKRVLPQLGDRPIYVTIDIDVVDPAFAPGTGTPEAGGITSTELLQVIYALKAKNVIGLDLVEVSPMNDVGDITALLGAKVVREAILAFGRGVVTSE